MTLPPGGRKLALVAHVGSSVGWLGAVVTSLAVAVAALALSIYKPRGLTAHGQRRPPRQPPRTRAVARVAD